MQTKNWMATVGVVAGFAAILVGGVAANAQKPSKNDDLHKLKDVKHAQHGYLVRKDLTVKHFDTTQKQKIRAEQKYYAGQLRHVKTQATAWRKAGHGKLTAQQVATINREKRNDHVAAGKFIDKRKIDAANERYAQNREYKMKRGDLKTDLHNYRKHGDAPRDLKK